MVAAYCPYCGAPAHKDWGCSDLGIGLKAIRDDQYRYDHEPSYKEGWDKGWRARQQEMEELRQDRRVLEKACEDLKVKVCNLEHRQSGSELDGDTGSGPRLLERH